MSNDPKKPFDAPPPGTPSLLQKEMDLERRNRPAPGFDAPRAAPGTRGSPTPFKAPAQPLAPLPQSLGRAAPQPMKPPAPGRQAPPSPTSFANHAAKTAPEIPAFAPVAGRNAEALFANQLDVTTPGTMAPERAVKSLSFGLGDDANNEPTRIAPYNLPDSGGLPAAAKPTSPGTRWKMRDPHAPLPPGPMVTPPPPDRLAAAIQETHDAHEARPSAPPASPAAAPAKPARTAPPAAPRGAAPEVLASPAGLMRRTFSWLVDLIIVGGLVAALLFAAVVVILPTGGSVSVNAPMALIEKVALPGAALAALMAFVYSALFAFLMQGRTVGRRLAGIHLVDGKGHAPGPIRAIFRAVLSVASFAFFLAGFWLALFDRRGQTLHDKLSRTFVVRLGADAT